MVWITLSCCRAESPWRQAPHAWDAPNHSPALPLGHSAGTGARAWSQQLARSPTGRRGERLSGPGRPTHRQGNAPPRCGTPAAPRTRARRLCAARSPSAASGGWHLCSAPSSYLSHRSWGRAGRSGLQPPAGASPLGPEPLRLSDGEPAPRSSRSVVAGGTARVSRVGAELRDSRIQISTARSPRDA